MDSNVIGGGNIELEGDGGDIKDTEEIFEMVDRSGVEDAGVHVLREESQRDKLRVRAGRRTWGFEERLKSGKGSEVVRKCWEEMRERIKLGRRLSDWKRERDGWS